MVPVPSRRNPSDPEPGPGSRPVDPFHKRTRTTGVGRELSEQMARNGGIINQIPVFSLSSGRLERHGERSRLFVFLFGSGEVRGRLARRTGGFGPFVVWRSGFLPGRVRKRELNYCFVLQRPKNHQPNRLAGEGTGKSGNRRFFKWHLRSYECEEC